jgi:hypothetical protein
MAGAAMFQGGGGAPVDDGESGVLLQLGEGEGKVGHLRI